VERRPRPLLSLPPRYTGHNQSDVRKVRAAAEWIIEHDHVAGVESALLYGRSDRHRHGTKVHRHVIAHGNDLPGGIKHGAGIVATLLDVEEKRSAAQRGPHFLRQWSGKDS